MRKTWTAAADDVRFAMTWRGTGTRCARRVTSAMVVLALLLSGCVGLPRHVEKFRSEALPNPQTTALGLLATTQLAANSVACYGPSGGVAVLTNDGRSPTRLCAGAPGVTLAWPPSLYCTE